MQIFSRISILFTVFNQIQLKNYQIKTNKIFNFSHKISQKRHFVAQKRLFLYEIHDFSRRKRQAGRVTTLHVHSKRFQENVLDGTKREYYDTWFRENVLDGTKSWSQ